MTLKMSPIGRHGSYKFAFELSSVQLFRFLDGTVFTGFTLIIEVTELVQNRRCCVCCCSAICNTPKKRAPESFTRSLLSSAVGQEQVNCFRLAGEACSTPA